MKFLVSLSVMLTLVSVCWCQTSYWQQQVNYKINVKLNDVENSLDGFEKIEYINHSPDTLLYIWFHLWPNAYKNDKTAFSDQLLENGRTDFYFSSRDDRGYINRLDFRVDNITAKLEDHPSFQDIVKLVLPTPLGPGGTILISTPFHVKLPYNFSRGGHLGQSYQVTQWYPKPAVYDSRGWHPMPYLDQGEFYSEFGNYEVTITLPENYVVAATGELQNEDEKAWLLNKAASSYSPAQLEKLKKNLIPKVVKETGNRQGKPILKEGKPPDKPAPARPGQGMKSVRQDSLHRTISSAGLKTLIYKQERIHDFAWFADKTFIVKHDTLQLQSARIIDLYSFFQPKEMEIWKPSISFMKDAIRTRSSWIGEYPFNVVSVVQAPLPLPGGMEYPTITVISALPDEQTLDETIAHEIGHNWFYASLASNERDHPWMDEGMNTYYDYRYIREKYKNNKKISLGPAGRFSEYDFERILFETIASVKRDQPINEPATAYSALNYYMVVYHKTAEWMKLLAKQIGESNFDSCMREYFRLWQFRHPYPEDFKAVVSAFDKTNLDSLFQLLDTTGTLLAGGKKKVRFSWLMNADPENKFHYISLAPMIGINKYDGPMIGAAIHNYNLPFTRLQFIAIPLYATRSREFNGIGRATYSWYPRYILQKVEVGASFEKFTQNDFTDSMGKRTNLGFTKFVPELRLEFKNPNPRSHLKRFMQFRSWFLSEDELHFFTDPLTNTDSYSKQKKNSNISQLRFVGDNSRALYPYHWEMQFEVSDDYGKALFTGNYFFNYADKGGLNLRWFAGKFFYPGGKTAQKQFKTENYQLNMTGPKGYEDYTYSNYFLGRNEYQGFLSQQIMMRDGAFKVRTDLLSSKIGKTDNWLTALNFTSDIPDRVNPISLLPVRVPIRIFADLGTYSDVWKKNSTTPKFLFDAGLQVSLLQDLINIYVPLLYSKQYRDYFKSTPNNNFWQRISFSIDIQNINYKKMMSFISL